MVDVDDAVRVAVNDPRRQNLHVACENNELDTQVSQKFDFTLLLFFLDFRAHGKNVEGNAKGCDNWHEVWMVTDDGCDFSRKFLDLVAVEQIEQAVVILGDEDGDSWS